MRTALDVFTDPGPFTVAEVARVIHCSTTYLYDCILAGSLAAGRVGAHYRIPADEARRLAVEAGLKPPAVPAPPAR
jgi:excisionase family DNA binding protein